MLIRHAILLLMSWPCARSIATDKPPLDDIFDQIATASENLGLSFEGPGIFSISTPYPTSASGAGTVRYENSNGFVPIAPTAAVPSVPAENLATNATAGGEADRATSGILAEDPAYPSETRTFLNLGVPGADRRSFDAQDGQNEFEILKVTNETPAIANYHDFYENMQNKLHRNGGSTKGGGHEEPDEPASGRTAAQNQRTKERIKKIERYLTKFNGEAGSRNGDGSENYHPFGGANAKPSGGRNKEIFEPEKVRSNVNRQSGGAFYDVYGEILTGRQRGPSSSSRSNYEGSGTGARQSAKPHGSANGKNRHVNSKPVVVVDPSDYETNVNYGAGRDVAKASSVDRYSRQKLRLEPETQAESLDDAESRVNREDRYGPSYERHEDNDDYSDEASDYPEVTEKPKRLRKSKRRPHSADGSRRLPKEHRGYQSSDDESDDSRKHDSPTRRKLRRPKAKPSYWNEDDGGRDPVSEEISEEPQGSVESGVGSMSEDGRPTKHASREKGASNWSQIGPNIEVSHSSGFEIDQIDKPKLLVPVNLNFVPLSSFDHATALGNSQGFDFTNVPNFVTATPIVSSPTPLLSTSQSVATPNVARPTDPVGNAPNVPSNNYVLSTAVPDVIVGHNTYPNHVQALLLPQMNVNSQFPPNVRTHYSPATVSPMFTVTQVASRNVQHLGPTAQSVAVQSFHTTVSPRPAISRNVHRPTINPASPTAQPQFVVPQTMLRNVPLGSPYNGHANYNILVNPNGLHGQNLIQHGDANGQGSTNAPPSATSPQPDPATSNNLHESESQRKKSTGQNSAGQFLATATYAVGNGENQHRKNNVASENKYFPANNHHLVNDNNDYYNEHRENQQMARPHQQQSFYQLYRDDRNSNAKRYPEPVHEVPTIVQSGHGIPLNFDSQNYANAPGQLQEQQSVLTPSVAAHRARDQSQQILKAANDIFENTWKQLQQLRTNEEAAKNMAYRHIYGVNDNSGSASSLNGNVANHLPGPIGNRVKAHLPNLGTQNVEILNPNIKPSPVDVSFVNPYGSVNHYPGAVLTTPIPIFTTVSSFFAPRPAVVTSAGDESANLRNYVNAVTQIGANGNRVNNPETRPDDADRDNRRPLYNPINFVPSIDLMKSQSMLNGKLAEALPDQLSLVPLIPGGNFFKNTYGAQSELVQKPRLSSDLEKYAEEMFRESLKTIYSTHKWNNDTRPRGNYTSADSIDLAKLKGELQRFKASVPDPSYSGKEVLEAHRSETKVRTAEPSRTTRKPDLSIAAIEQLFKAAVKQNLPSSSDSSHDARHKNRQSNAHASPRPGSSSDHSSDFRKTKHRLSDYLTPPKPNSFVSKSPFNDSPKPVKKRPGSPPSRYSSNNGNSRPVTRTRPASGPEASASSHLESGVHAGGPRYDKHRHRPPHYPREKESHRHVDLSDYRTDRSFDDYPTFTTSSSTGDDSLKPLSDEHSSKSEYIDINHPRTHNLLGLLMKNKQLPTGTAQSFLRDDDEPNRYYENDNRRVHLQFFDDKTNDFRKKADGRNVNVASLAPPDFPQIRYYTG